MNIGSLLHRNKLLYSVDSPDPRHSRHALETKAYEQVDGQVDDKGEVDDEKCNQGGDVVPLL